MTSFMTFVSFYDIVCKRSSLAQSASDLKMNRAVLSEAQLKCQFLVELLKFETDPISLRKKWEWVLRLYHCSTFVRYFTAQILALCQDQESALAVQLTALSLEAGRENPLNNIIQKLLKITEHQRHVTKDCQFLIRLCNMEACGLHLWDLRRHTIKTIYLLEDIAYIFRDAPGLKRIFG